MDNLMVLRKVRDLSPQTLTYLMENGEGEKPYFPDFVDNDRPRDDAITQELMESTQGFAVASPDGTVWAKFKDLQKAEAARANATVGFNVDVQVDEGEELEGEDIV